jgi:uncharacterized membrane-anchored protein YjiN (DUF445 family)
MKRIANGLLIVVTLIFALTTFLEEQYPWIGFIRATAEAAMVGAIADWFAVTALFRYPLGLKIPHTAIIPNRKQDISRNFARFVRDNFLTQEVITDKLHSMQVTDKMARWLNQPDNSALIAEHLAVGVSALVVVIQDEAIQGLVESRVIALIRATPFAPLIGHVLQLLISNQRQQELMVETVRLGGEFMQENRPIIIQKINHELPRWAVLLGVDKRIYRTLVEAIDNTLAEIKTNPDHPLYRNFQKTVDRFITDLKTSPEVLAKEIEIKEEILQHAIVQQFSSSLWEDIKSSLSQRGSNPDRELQRAIQQVLIGLSQAMLTDPALYAKVDRWLIEAMLYFIQTYGHEVEHLISTTIDRWDAAQVTQKIEQEVGKDLQYIRINGTLIGGLAGLIIYTVAVLAKQF